MFIDAQANPGLAVVGGILAFESSSLSSMPEETTMSLTARVSSTWRGTYTKTSDVADGVQNLDRSVAIEFANGVGANQANVLWADTRTLAASATEDLDLSGVLADVFGATVTQARVKAIRISAAAGNTNNVIVGAASGTQWASLL